MVQLGLQKLIAPLDGEEKEDSNLLFLAGSVEGNHSYNCILCEKGYLSDVKSSSTDAHLEEDLVIVPKDLAQVPKDFMDVIRMKFPLEYKESLGAKAVFKVTPQAPHITNGGSLSYGDSGTVKYWEHPSREKVLDTALKDLEKGKRTLPPEDQNKNLAIYKSVMSSKEEVDTSNAILQVNFSIEWKCD